MIGQINEKINFIFFQGVFIRFLRFLFIYVWSFLRVIFQVLVDVIIFFCLNLNVSLRFVVKDVEGDKVVLEVGDVC